MKFETVWKFLFFTLVKAFKKAFFVLKKNISQIMFY